jgi:hypothetical protein
MFQLCDLRVSGVSDAIQDVLVDERGFDLPDSSLRTIRSLNQTPAETLDELSTRREAAARLAELRHKMQRESWLSL